MWRRFMYRTRPRVLGPQKSVHSLIVFGAALALFLTAAAVFSQDTVPPPPPDQAAGSGQDQAESVPNDVRAVRLSDVEGEVQVFQGDQLAFSQAEPNMPAVEGMRFTTGENGRLEIEFEDGSVARMTPNSSIRLTVLQRNGDGTSVTQIDALSGLSYFELSAQGGKFTVKFDSELCTPIDSAVFRIGMDSAPNELAVMHGAVHVDDGQGVALDVHPSQTFQTDPQQPGEFTVAQSINADSWDQWNSDRDQALAALESSETTARASTGNPDDPAWNDLDAYGNWYDLPGYGQVWSPSGVDASWDPFGDGYWGYYPSFGYTWISGYPWGWWPYHCGAWDFVDGWGWLWVPGNCGMGYYGTGWYPYATVWRIPKNYVPPPRPRHHPGPQPRPTPLIAVNRGPQFTAPFQHITGPRPEPRPLAFDGRTIAPLTANIHPTTRGPLGESYSASLVRTHPEMATTVSRTPDGRTVYTPTPGTRTFAQPAGTFHPFNSPAAHGSTSTGGGGHPASSGGGHPSSGGGGGSSSHGGGGGSTGSSSHH